MSTFHVIHVISMVYIRFISEHINLFVLFSTRELFRLFDICKIFANRKKFLTNLLRVAYNKRGTAG
jgi:hypothetical protein